MQQRRCATTYRTAPTTAPSLYTLAVSLGFSTPNWRSSLYLHENFFSEITGSAVPVDLRAIHQLKGSPLALDLYTWLTHRMSYLRRPTLVPWKGLQAQLGANYDRSCDFRRKVLARLEDVVGVYPELRIQKQNEGLRLYPSPPHVKSDALERDFERSRDLVVVPWQRLAHYPALSVVDQIRANASSLIGACWGSSRPQAVQWLQATQPEIGAVSKGRLRDGHDW